MMLNSFQLWRRKGWGVEWEPVSDKRFLQVVPPMYASVAYNVANETVVPYFVDTLLPAAVDRVLSDQTRYTEHSGASMMPDRRRAQMLSRRYFVDTAAVI